MVFSFSELIGFFTALVVFDVTWSVSMDLVVGPLL